MADLSRRVIRRIWNKMMERNNGDNREEDVSFRTKVVRRAIDSIEGIRRAFIDFNRDVYHLVVWYDK